MPEGWQLRLPWWEGPLVALTIILGVALVFAILFGGCVRSLFREHDVEKARIEIQALYDRAGPRGAVVVACRAPTADDGSLDPSRFVCRVRTPRCVNEFAFDAPRASSGRDADARPVNAGVVPHPCWR